MRIAATVGLNLEPRQTPRQEQNEESKLLAAPGRGPRRGKLLMMDDDRLVREMMHRQLAICGYEVTVTSRGEDAVSAYRRAREEGRPFDGVILYLMVGDGWGGERTLAELLSFDPGVKALVVSGSLDGPRTHYERKGFRGILGKPYSLEELRREVEAVLRAGE